MAGLEKHLYGGIQPGALTALQSARERIIDDADTME
jgi:hypothetical protein